MISIARQSCQPNPADSPKGLLRTVRTIVVALVRDLARGQLNLHAMSLVYTTLLSLVPLLALSFSVLKGFGVQNQLEPALTVLLAPLGEKANEVSALLIGFVSNVKVGVLGAVGLGILLYTVSSLMTKIVSSINFTWSLHGRRGVAQRLPDYLAMLLVAPLLLFSLAGAATGAVQTELVKSLLQFHVIDLAYQALLMWLPLVLNAAALTFVYWFFPAISVRWYAALTGGVLAAVVWKLIGFVFSTFVVNSGNYTAIYSAFATVLLFMIWLYLSWLTLLLGSRIAYYTQYPAAASLNDDEFTPVGIEFAGLEALRVIVSRFRDGQGPVPLSELKARGQASEALIVPLLQRLEDRNLLRSLGGHDNSYLLARDPATISMAEIITIVRNSEGRKQAPSVPVARLQQQLNQAIETAFGGITLAQWSDWSAADPSQPAAVVLDDPHDQPLPLVQPPPPASG